MTLKLITLSLLVLSLGPLMSHSVPVKQREVQCNGPNEHMISTSGGCFVDFSGNQHCLPSKPPSCECDSGFERNSANGQCEAAVTPSGPYRIGRRDVNGKEIECSGPHEQLIQIGGGCYRPGPDADPVCLPPKKPECVCESGYERNPVTKLCEAISANKSAR